MTEWVRIKKGVSPYPGKLLRVKRRERGDVVGHVRVNRQHTAVGERTYRETEVEPARPPREERDDGTRHGRMEGQLPRVHKRGGGHVGMVVGDTPVFYDIDVDRAVDVRAETLKVAMARWPGRTLEYVDLPDGAVGLRPYQREMLRAFTEQPLAEHVEGDTYEAFVDRYTKGDVTPTGRRVGKHPALGAPYGGGGPSRRYGGRMDDMLRQSRPRTIHHYIYGGGEGNRQLAYYAYGMAAMQDNRIDDVYNRRQRRAEADLRRYCEMDVWFTADYAAVELRILFTLLDGYSTVPVSHRIKAPYGRGETSPDWGIHISLIYTGEAHERVTGTPRPNIETAAGPWPDRHIASVIAGLAVSFGCPAFLSRNIADCMFGSGRYDCAVTLSQRALHNLQNCMEAVGGTATINCSDRRGWMNYLRPDDDGDIR